MWSSKLIDRPDLFIVLHYEPNSQGQNYLQRPASSLQLEDKPGDPTSEADLVALLRLIFKFAQQDYTSTLRSRGGLQDLRRSSTVVLRESFKIHPELFPEPKPGAPVRTDYTLATYRRALNRSSTPGGPSLYILCGL